MTTTSQSNADQKAELRKAVMSRRNAVPVDERKDAAARISDVALTLDVVKGATILGGYWPIRSEIDPRAMTEALRADGKVIALPAVLDKTTIDFRRWQSEADLVDAGFGTFAPGDHAETIYPDVILAPMVGFDRRGIRLGYGGGYYDRYVERLINMDKRPLLVGIAHSCQEVERVPNEVYDIALDCVVTEKEFIICSSGTLA
ncbi:5-formyltetrahydrofolate cyclo-ligase [Coralliovum pocilloporae]|uniref:5-formyltetrahydrofolate cyclo-ligase n=1 Tax=Coralliovum pocilloporae TaxID=3066369 RepID=UPI003306EF89